MEILAFLFTRTIYRSMTPLLPNRPSPEMHARGWAIRPPPSTERYTVEQRSYLMEMYDWPEGRLSDEQAFQSLQATGTPN